MIKKYKIQKVSRDLIQYSATKNKETRNKILGQENILIYKSLIPTFGKPTEVSQK